MLEVFLTADTHFYHRNIIEYCKRPYSCVEEMNEAIVDNWNSVVGTHDIVIHLGDISFGTVKETREILGRLNGIKHLIMGNHDRLGHAKWARKDPGLIYDFFEVRGDYLRMTLEKRKKLVLCHFPMASWERGYYQFHGHTHGQYQGRHMQLDVGVDNVGMRPIHVDEAIKLALDNHTPTAYK